MLIISCSCLPKVENGEERNRVTLAEIRYNRTYKYSSGVTE